MHVFCQISNLLGIFPVVYCFQKGDFELGMMIALCFFLSFLYHMDERSDLGLLADTIGCSFLIAAFTLCLLKTNILTPANLLSACLIASALFYWFEAGDDTETYSYSFYHTLWHAMMVYAISFFVYSYLTDEDDSRFLCHALRRTRSLHKPDPQRNVDAKVVEKTLDRYSLFSRNDMLDLAVDSVHDVPEQTVGVMQVRAS
jgi:hypothetical protein